MAYIVGVADAMGLGPMPFIGWHACIPAGVEQGQVRDASFSIYKPIRLIGTSLRLAWSGLP